MVEFNLDQLQCFVKAAEAGSFSAAARQLYRSQSAVSTAVANLEIHLDVELFDRSCKYLQLTPQGKALLRQAEAILAGCVKMEKAALQYSTDVDASIRIVVDEALYDDLLLPLLDEFSTLFPATELDIRIGVFHEIESRVVSDGYDIGIMVGSFVPAECPNYRLLAYIPFVAVAAANHPLARRSEISLDDLLDERQLVVADRREKGEGDVTIFSKRVWWHKSYYSALCLVQKGLGWTFIPQSMLTKAVKEKQCVKINLQMEHLAHSSPQYLLWNSESKLGKAGNWLYQKLLSG